MTYPDLLTRTQATEHLREYFGPVGDSHLAHRAHAGDGPPFVRKGYRALYDRNALHNWAMARLALARRHQSERSGNPDEERARWLLIRLCPLPLWAAREAATPFEVKVAAKVIRELIKLAELTAEQQQVAEAFFELDSENDIARACRNREMMERGDLTSEQRRAIESYSVDDRAKAISNA